MKKLNIGCGRDIKPGFVNIDIVKLPGVDKVVNLNKYPWPLKDNTFDYIFCAAVIEHVEDVVKTMEEIHRICKNEAVVEITVPHFSSMGAFKDPTHKHFFTYYSFDYFTDKNNYNFYSKARFKILKRRIIYPKTLFILEWIANAFPKFHEVFFKKISTS
jgi:SAM-dependent methyltransferase